MKDAQGLGVIERYPVRGIWPNEAQDFTPWLACDENIALLGQALGVELEVEQIEMAVGPYSADILAKEAGTGRFVVIENQLEKTNHDHLGKSITYASVLDATTIVWIATEFTEEHQKALNWLNDNTSEDIAFYGVQLELWRIGDSNPAVRFSVVSRPASIVKQAASNKASGELTEARQMQLEFWTQFRDELAKSRIVPSTQKPRPQYWYDVSLGRSGIHISNTANTYDHKIGVRVYISNRIAQVALPALEAEREAIEGEIGCQLEWNPNPENRDKIIAAFYNADLTDRARWGEYVSWMMQMTERFRRAFAPRVRNLNLSSGERLSNAAEARNAAQQ